MLNLKPKAAFFALFLSVFFMALSQLPKPGLASDSPFVTKTVEGDFKEVFEGLKDVIVGKGINIAHTLGSSDMLNRTAPSFNIKKNIFINAEIVEFCSAKISHELVQKNPLNITLCPFTISAYVLTDDPKNVHLTYRKPVSIKGSEEVVAQIVKLLEDIIKEATDW